MQTNKGNLIVKYTFEFALEAIQYVERLELNKKYNMANQLFRSATTIGANVREAQNAESKFDFIHKLKIAAKKADETEYRILLCEQSENHPEPVSLIEKIESIDKFLSEIISTSKKIIN